MQGLGFRGYGFGGAGSGPRGFVMRIARKMGSLMGVLITWAVHGGEEQGYHHSGTRQCED